MQEAVMNTLLIAYENFYKTTLAAVGSQHILSEEA